MNDEEAGKLRARVANLELALHGMWSMLQHLQPPATQEAIGDMMAQHFDTLEPLGSSLFLKRGFQSAPFPKE